MRRPALVLAGTLLCLAAFFPRGGMLSADAALSGTASVDLRLMIDPGAFLDSELEQVSRLSPRLSVQSGTYAFSAAASVGFESSSGAADFRLEALELALRAADWMGFRLGWFDYLPGAARFLSNTNFFSRIDYERLLAGRLEEALVPAALLQAELTFFDFYLRLTVSPFRPQMILSPVGSPWFFGSHFPRSLIEPAFGNEVVLNELSYMPEPPPPYDLSEVSWSPELGGSVWGVDFALLYYHGYDNTPLLSAELIPHGLYDQDPYDIELTPVYRRVHTLGLDLAASISSLRLWADAAYTFNKSFLTNEVSFTLPTTQVVTAPFVEYSLGCSYALPFFELTAWGELRNSHVLDPSGLLLRPPLSSALLAGLDASLFDSRLSSQVALACSIAEPSGAAVLRLSYTPVAGLAVRFLAPFFFGPPDTELGQYRRNHFLSLQVVWEF
jgi:hypothetical protein